MPQSGVIPGQGIWRRGFLPYQLSFGSPGFARANLSQNLERYWSSGDFAPHIRTNPGDRDDHV